MGSGSDTVEVPTGFSFTLNDFTTDDVVKIGDGTLSSISAITGGIIAKMSDGEATTTIYGVSKAVTANGWAMNAGGFSYQTWTTSGASIAADDSIIYA
ncbi:hypothetical protein DCD75_18620, partial [Acinetobacter baumannii]